jgi:hypothetical protein
VHNAAGELLIANCATIIMQIKNARAATLFFANALGRKRRRTAKVNIA